MRNLFKVDFRDEERQISRPESCPLLLVAHWQEDGEPREKVQRGFDLRGEAERMIQQLYQRNRERGWGEAIRYEIRPNPEYRVETVCPFLPAPEPEP